jgi:hypothetical protein
MMEKQKNELPAAVAKDFECVGVEPGRIKYKGAVIDLRSISVKKAKVLADDPNFGNLKAKAKAADTK